MSDLEIRRFISGDNIKCITRIKPAVNFAKEDLRPQGNNVFITDGTSRGKIIINNSKFLRSTKRAKFTGVNHQ
jgi:hypothetical protein